MTLYMDIHRELEGLTEEAVADAHARDLEVQEKYGANYLKYWFDEGTGTVFCLIEAIAAHHSQFPLQPHMLPHTILQELMGQEYFVHVSPVVAVEAEFPALHGP